MGRPTAFKAQGLQGLKPEATPSCCSTTASSRTGSRGDSSAQASTAESWYNASLTGLDDMPMLSPETSRTGTADSVQASTTESWCNASSLSLDVDRFNAQHMPTPLPDTIGIWEKRAIGEDPFGEGDKDDLHCKLAEEHVPSQPLHSTARRGTFRGRINRIQTSIKALQVVRETLVDQHRGGKVISGQVQTYWYQDGGRTVDNAEY